MKLEKYLEEKFSEIWRAVDKLNKSIYGNGEEKGLKTKVSNILTIKKHNKFLISVFCVALLTITWTAGYFGFKAAVSQIVDEKNIELVEQINDLRYMIENSEVEVIMEY